MIGGLVAGFRHAVRVPAELAANWAVKLAWNEEQQPYMTGVKRAGFLILVAAPVITLSPLSFLTLGLQQTIVHLAFGLLLGRLLIDALFMSYASVPFVCSYLPSTNLKLIMPDVVAASVLVTYAIASIEQILLAGNAVALIAGTAGMLGAITLIDRRRQRHAVDFDELPEFATQRLGLF